MSIIDTSPLLADAMSAYVAGDLRQAEVHTKRALALSPTDVPATVMLGLICARLGRKQAAIVYLGNALARDPSCYEAHVALSTLLFSEGKTDEAVRHGELAIDLRPDEADSYLHFSRDLIQNGLLPNALGVLLKGQEVAPDEPAILQDLAATLSGLGNMRESAQAWEKLVSVEPGSLIGWLKLGGVRLSLNNYEAAIACGLRAVEIDDNSADAHILVALGLAEVGRAADAEPHLRRAIDLQPQEHIAHAALGLSLQEQGRFEEARAHLERTIQLSPTNGQAYYSLIRSRKVTAGDLDTIREMEAVCEHVDASALDRSYLQYALGKAREDLGEYEAAMGHYDQATALAAQVWFGGREPDHDWYRSMVQSTIDTFTPSMMVDLQREGLSSETPLLVVGMMRSGTTLVEQIVSSHPSVVGGGELTYWHDHAGRLFDPASGRVNRALLPEVAEGYLSLLAGIGGGAARVTDKLPHNYAMLGFVMAALPNAKVIHVRRNPLDNCLSIYTTAFNRPPEFSLLRSNIVFAYREYQRLMAHWKAVLPADRLLEVEYESLIANREEETRRMVAFAGLEWEEQCLHHEDNVRSVNTPSVWQVRQPIYKTSVERWRRFEPWLGEFAQLRD